METKHMARKVFISVLGNGFYIPSIYTANNKDLEETKFIQRATLESLHAEQWTENDAVYILLTEDARKKNWNVLERTSPKEKETVKYIGLQKELESVRLSASIHDIDIPEGKNENEIWQIFQIVYGLLQDGDELYFDLTQ